MWIAIFFISFSFSFQTFYFGETVSHAIVLHLCYVVYKLYNNNIIKNKSQTGPLKKKLR